MKKNKIHTLFLLPLLSGCALFTPAPDNSKVLTKEINALKDEINLQKEEITQLNLKLKNLEDEKKFLRVVKQVSTPTKKSLKARGKGKMPVAPISKVEKAEPSTLFEDEATIADSSHEELHKYFKAVQLLREKKQDEGLILLREFISENPGHIYADRAEMLIADTHLRNKEYGLVIVSTNVLENRYPHSVKLPEALYKRAMAFMALDQKDQARKTWERVRNDYPKSKIADMAEKRLAAIKTPLLSDAP